MRKQFKEQFAKICSEFDTVFKELFGGGKGTLELMEDEDCLLYTSMEYFRSSLGCFQVSRKESCHIKVEHMNESGKKLVITGQADVTLNLSLIHI